MQLLELLSPAKNLECGIAAIDHGADAVYIGAPKFGARAAAGNSINDIAKLCNYAHLFRVKVFVTINTIIYDNEIHDVLDMVHQLDQIGVDALLIQDMGLLSLLLNEGLSCHLHASTQTDNRSVEKVKWLSSLGLKRVVLARELSIDEIEEIHRQIPNTELEVFVHGALCVSYSGQCYASHYCFHRSANRGECAQFCRLAFTLKDADGNILENERHLLSLRDMAQISNLERLAFAGATSFKIEGRLKDSDYVKNITAAYSEALNSIVAKYPDKFRRVSKGHCSYTFTPNIAKSFNRGFTTYFADGRQRNMVSFDTPKAMGEPVGKVKEIKGRSFNVAGTASFFNGDGLCFLDSNNKLVGFRVNKVEGNRIYPLRMPLSLRPGTMLFRNFDQAFTSMLSRQSAERKINISFSLKAENNTLTLFATDECGRNAKVSAYCELQKAQKSQRDNIHRQLSKLGGTVYQCSEIEILTDAFVPSSILSDLRRKAIDAIGEYQFLKEETVQSDKAQESIAPHYSHSYLYNAANDKAVAFYASQGISASSFEKAQCIPSPLIMQCRFCLKSEMGYCSKTGRKAPWREPLTLFLSDGKNFTLQFDCNHCQMNVIAANK